MLTRERSFGWYCGTANRAQYSVLGQYFGQGEVCPNFLRADKGAETLFAGEAHLAMYVEAAVAPASTISTAVAPAQYTRGSNRDISYTTRQRTSQHWPKQ